MEPRLLVRQRSLFGKIYLQVSGVHPDQDNMNLAADFVVQFTADM